MTNRFEPVMQAMIWTCKMCGFAYEGGQPKQNCPACEAYKTSFIDLPQHLEAQVREAHPGLHFNHALCRKMRLELMKENDVVSKARVQGRVLPSRSGEHINPSDDY